MVTTPEQRKLRLQFRIHLFEMDWLFNDYVEHEQWEELVDDIQLMRDQMAEFTEEFFSDLPGYLDQANQIFDEYQHIANSRN